MQTAPVVWVEGIIGAGKSTLTRKLADALGYEAIHEPVEGNPWLKRYYEAHGLAMSAKDKPDGPDYMVPWEKSYHLEHFKHVAFSMQMYMLHVRYALQKKAVGLALTGTGALIDRGMPGDRVFAKMLVNDGLFDPLDFETYTMAYEVMCNDLRPPSLIVYLDVAPEVGLARTRERARGVETGLTLEYMENLTRGYYDMLSEIESNRHPWSRGMEILRWPYNTNHLPIQPLLDEIKKRT